MTAGSSVGRAEGSYPSGRGFKSLSAVQKERSWKKADLLNSQKIVSLCLKDSNLNNQKTIQ